MYYFEGSFMNGTCMVVDIRLLNIQINWDKIKEMLQKYFDEVFFAQNLTTIRFLEKHLVSDPPLSREILYRYGVQMSACYLFWSPEV